jgi:hypothetical protein
VKQQKLLVGIALSFGKSYHSLRRRPTSFDSRFLKEFEESLLAFTKTAFFYLEPFLRTSLSARMCVIPHLPICVPHVEKLPDLPAAAASNLFSDKPSNNTRRTGKQRSTGAGDSATPRRYR